MCFTLIHSVCGCFFPLTTNLYTFHSLFTTNVHIFHSLLTTNIHIFYSLLIISTCLADQVSVSHVVIQYNGQYDRLFISVYLFYLAL